jgi:hypothetical protein
MARGELGNLVVSDQHEQTLHVRDQFSGWADCGAAHFPCHLQKTSLEPMHAIDVRGMLRV